MPFSLVKTLRNPILFGDAFVENLSSWPEALMAVFYRFGIEQAIYFKIMAEPPKSGIGK